MKKVMFALCFMFGGIVVVSAQDTQDTTSNQYRTETQSQYPQDVMQQQDRQRIQATELPDEVKRTLEGQEYRGWLISGAFTSQGSGDQSMGSDTTSTSPNQQESSNATGAEGEQIYIVELKNGAETKTVRFDSNGQKLEGMEGEQNGQSGQYDQSNQNQNSQNNQDSQNNQYNQDSQNNQDTPNNQDSQNNQNNQYNQDSQLNQNDRMDQTTPSDQARPTDPNATDQSQSDQSESGQSATPTHPEQSTSTPSGQSPGTETQTDQSRANGPK